MEIAHLVLNVMFIPLTLFALLVILPYHIFFKIFRFAKKFIYSESVAGKVVLVTGAASGIGEQVACEYARRGARLVLVDKREECLPSVAERVRSLGSPDVIAVSADVSREEDCKKSVDATINHFGRLDHLVNNAGTAKSTMFENLTNVSESTLIMDVNFWGAVYFTHFAIPHLRKSKGRIVAIASMAGCSPFPRLSIYGASKAALISFYETLRTEIGDQIGITIVTPGLINTPLVLGDKISDDIGFIPKESSEECGRAIVKSACRGDRYLVEPFWYWAFYPFSVLCSQLLERFMSWLIVPEKITEKKHQ